MAGTTGVAAAETYVTTATTTPTPVETAQTKADAARARADTLAKRGGWEYKSGAYDRAKAEAAAWQSEADAEALAAASPAPPPTSPALDDAQDRLATFQFAGGWAYKSGLVRSTEADIARLQAEAGQEVQIGKVQENPPANWNKPVEKTWRDYR